MPLPPISGMELLSPVISVAEGRPTCFSSIGIAVIHTHTHTHTYIYIYIGKLMSLHPYVPRSPIAVSQGPRTQIRHAAPPWRGCPL
jgi:hypothetical protein